MISSFSKILILVIFVLQVITSQSLMPEKFSLSKQQTTSSSFTSPISNSITDIVIQGDTIWLGTGKGLSRSTDGGRSWKNYLNTPEFGTEDISAIGVRGKIVWVATAHNVERNGESLPEGGGLRYSSDGGDSWKIIPQPIDKNNVDTLVANSKSTVDSYTWNPKSLIRALGITTTINNITYDIAVTDSTVYIVSFAGMARRSRDHGVTWDRIILPPDNLPSISINDSLIFDLSPSGGALGLQNNLNHRTFSVYAENDSEVWIGTAGGLNKTINSGKSWIKFSQQNQLEPISGNFVVGIGKQKAFGKDLIWAATINASDPSEKRGVSFSDNGGISWKQTLLGEFAHNIGVKDSSAIYIPTDNGIFRSSDFGKSWALSGTIYDKSSKQKYTSTKFYAAASQKDTIWFGGNDGVVKTIDNPNNYFGSNWTVLHAFQSLNGKKETYAYPNPFAPDDETVRIHFTTSGRNETVTIRVFDFGMNLVRTVIQNAPREGSIEHDDLWDGKDNNGTIVSNGVYFYHVIIGNDEPIWGKILVIQ
jgi:hypothetical protein